MDKLAKMCQSNGISYSKYKFQVSRNTQDELAREKRGKWLVLYCETEMGNRFGRGGYVRAGEENSDHLPYFSQFSFHRFSLQL